MLPRSVTLHNSQLSLASMVARPFTPSVQDGHIGDALLRGSESVWGHGSKAACIRRLAETRDF